MIEVRKIDNNTFEVTVEASTATTHQVSLDDQYFNKIAGDATTKEKLIKASFEFLLKRESNTMILSAFDLPVIQSYFPNYEKDIKRDLGG